jgi:hypothetical protein
MRPEPKENSLFRSLKRAKQDDLTQPRKSENLLYKSEHDSSTITKVTVLSPSYDLEMKI